MSNPEHIAKLLQGPDAWNAWRKAAPEIIPDLSDSLLTVSSGMPPSVFNGPLDLGGANLNAADLSGMALTTVNLHGADLSHANLCDTTLIDSDLTLANLSHADLRGALLDNCSVAGAKMDSAKLHNADLTGGQGAVVDQMIGAFFDETTLFPDELRMAQAWRERHEEAAHWEGDDPPPNRQSSLPSRSPLEILQLPKGAKAEEIRLAFRALAKKYHPDVCPGDPEAEHRFKEINEAYRIAIELAENPWAGRNKTPIARWRTAAAIFAGTVLLSSSALLFIHYGLDRSPRSPADPVVTGSTDSASNTAQKLAIRDKLKIDKRSGSGEALPKTADPESDQAPSAVVSGEKAQPNRLDVRARRPDEKPNRVAALPVDSPPKPSHDDKGANIKPAKSAAPSIKTQCEIEPSCKDWIRVRKTLHARMIAEAAALPANSAPAADESLLAIKPGVPVPENRNVPRRAQISSRAPYRMHRWATFIGDLERNDADLVAWKQAEASGTIANYSDYLAAFPEGQFVRKADRRIAALRLEIEHRKLDEAAWDIASGEETIPALKAYRRDFPNGRYAGVAANRIIDLRNSEIERKKAIRLKEDKTWEQAARKNTRVAILGYLKSYPEGKYAKAARKALIELETAAAEPPPKPEPLPVIARPEKPRTPEKPRIEPQRRAHRFPSSDEPFVDAGPRSD